MLQFTVVVESSLLGVDACVPSIRECEAWGATEDEALSALLDRLAFFLGRESGFKHSIDYMRKEDAKTYYKLIIR